MPRYLNGSCAQAPTLPAAPRTRIACPGSIRAYSNSVCHAVTATTGRPAAVT
jgi:hypothetical protein